MTHIEPIAVDHGIPAPRRWASKNKYPWLTMKPGDSFEWPGKVEDARTACKIRRRRHGEQYRVAKVTEDGRHLIRVWRMA